MNKNIKSSDIEKVTSYPVGANSLKKDTSDLEDLFQKFDKEFSINQELITDIYKKLAPVLDPGYATTAECQDDKKGYSTELNCKVSTLVDTLEIQNKHLQELKSRINLY
jgi:Skp family chaperone for outer membrane proteins